VSVYQPVIFKRVKFKIQQSVNNNLSSPVMEVSKKGNLWSIKTSTSLKSMELKFKIGKETTTNGQDVTACASP
jgi:hypothetical protein